MTEDLRRYQIPITPLPPAVDATERLVEPPEEREEGKWQWIGDPNRPEAEKFDDGISDLFEVGNEDDTADLISVDIDKDILDVNERGSLDDLTSVSMEDILGDEETGQIPLEYSPDDEEIREMPMPQQRNRATPRATRRPIRYTPPMSAGRGGM